MIMTNTTQERDTNGLIKGLTYPRQPNGRIDWRALLNPAHIVFNSKNERLAAEVEKTYGASAKNLVYADVVAKQSVDDRHILVLLKGWQELAELRGFTSSIPTSISVAPGIAAVAWSIKWIPNEEDPQGKETGATADATMENTGGFGYLGAMAGNRAFVRAVRQGLGVNVLSFDEIATKDEPLQEAGNVQSAPVTGIGEPVPMLKRVCAEASIEFNKLVLAAAKYKETLKSDPESWTKFEDVHPLDCMTLIKKIKERKKKA